MGNQKEAKDKFLTIPTIPEGEENAADRDREAVEKGAETTSG
jgi:hypothetical protein